MTRPIDGSTPPFLPSYEEIPPDSPQLGHVCARLILDDINAARRYLDDLEEFLKKEP